jgi:hypothetical protein
MNTLLHDHNTGIKCPKPDIDCLTSAIYYMLAKRRGCGVGRSSSFKLSFTPGIM